MRKIMTKAEKEKKERRTKWLIGLVFIGMMVLSILGYGLRNSGVQNKKNAREYNGFQFIQQQGFWHLVDKGESKFIFRYAPWEIKENITNASLIPLENYLQKPLYIRSENPGAEIEIARNLQQFLLRPATRACLSEKQCPNTDLPIKTCKDNFIIIQSSEDNSIQRKENCVFLNSSSSDLTEIADEFLFRLLKIKE